ILDGCEIRLSGELLYSRSVMAASWSQNPVFLSLLVSRRCLIAGRIVGFMPRRGSVARIGLPTGVLLIAACDPVLNVPGANFPSWLLCEIAGATRSAVFLTGVAGCRDDSMIALRLSVVHGLI